MNWKHLVLLPLALIPFRFAWAGSGYGELTCKSESGKVELKGSAPVYSTPVLNLTYAGKTITIGDRRTASYLTDGFDHFTLLLKREDNDILKLSTLPQSVVDRSVEGGKAIYKFDAMLTVPLESGPVGNGDRKQLFTAILKCIYHPVDYEEYLRARYKSFKEQQAHD